MKPVLLKSHIFDVMLRSLYVKLLIAFRRGLSAIFRILKIYPKVVGRKETLDYILRNNCSVSRYGDGEFLLMTGWYIGFQKYDEKLAIRLREILKSDLKNHIVCLPDVFRTTSQLTDKASEFWNKNLRDTLCQWCRLTKLNKWYYDTQITRFYIDLKDKRGCSEYIQNLQKIWNGRDVVIIEGAKSRMGYNNDLFCNVKSLKRILCPSENAFSSYDKILLAAKTHISKCQLVLIALGPTATVLAYDLAKEGYQAIDSGHMDVEYEWFKLGVTEKCAIDGKYVNEVNSRDVKELTDIEFKNQILTQVE